MFTKLLNKLDRVRIIGDLRKDRNDQSPPVSSFMLNSVCLVGEDSSMSMKGLDWKNPVLIQRENGNEGSALEIQKRAGRMTYVRQVKPC